MCRRYCPACRKSYANAVLIKGVRCCPWCKVPVGRGAVVVVKGKGVMK